VHGIVLLGLLLARHVQWLGEIADADYDPAAPRQSAWPRAEAWLARDATTAELVRYVNQQSERQS
jgi:hypothetical protein